jgi:hypothetical protein
MRGFFVGWKTSQSKIGRKSPSTGQAKKSDFYTSTAWGKNGGFWMDPELSTAAQKIRIEVICRLGALPGSIFSDFKGSRSSDKSRSESWESGGFPLMAGIEKIPYNWPFFSNQISTFKPAHWLTPLERFGHLSLSFSLLAFLVEPLFTTKA